MLGAASCVRAVARVLSCTVPPALAGAVPCACAACEVPPLCAPLAGSLALLPSPRRGSQRGACVRPRRRRPAPRPPVPPPRPPAASANRCCSPLAPARPAASFAVASRSASHRRAWRAGPSRSPRLAAGPVAPPAAFALAGPASPATPEAPRLPCSPAPRPRDLPPPPRRRSPRPWPALVCAAGPHGHPLSKSAPRRRARSARPAATPRRAASPLWRVGAPRWAPAAAPSRRAPPRGRCRESVVAAPGRCAPKRPSRGARAPARARAMPAPPPCPRRRRRRALLQP